MQEENFNNNLNKKSDDSDSLNLSQICTEKGLINNESRIMREKKEYLELNLVGESKQEDLDLVKVGNYFVKKNSSIDIPQAQLRSSFIKKYIEGGEVERFFKSDILVKDDPQYNVDYIRDIFKHLKESEVF
jgi:hypothetical protein